MPNTARPGLRVSPPVRADEDDELDHLVAQLAGARSIDQITALVTPVVRGLLHADGTTFVLREAERCYYAEEDAVAPLWKGRRFPLNNCISGWCMLNRQAAAIADVQKDPRIPQDAYRPTFVRSLAMAPAGRDEPVAALGAYWAEVRQIQPAELQLLQRIADAAAPALARVQSTAAAPRPIPKPPGRPPAPARRKRLSLPARVARLQRDGLRQNSPQAFLFAVGSVAVATVVRLAVGEFGEQHLQTFSTYYPAVLLSVLVGGLAPGLLAAALGGLAAYLAFMSPVMRFVPLTHADAVNLMLYLGAAGLLVGIVHRYQAQVLRLIAEDARHLTLAREQQHRLHNAVQVVETIVRLTLKDEPARIRLLNQRIRAGLADIGCQIAGDRTTSLRALFAEELEAFDLGRFIFSGDEAVLVSPDQRAIVTLAVHELTTNALKYGALSSPAGRVEVDWKVARDRLSIVWREMGGPEVAPPRKRGYGTALLHRLVEASHGSVHTEFDPAGVVVRIVLPLRRQARS